MIIIDDYANGIIKIGNTKHDFGALSQIELGLLEELPLYITEGNAYYYCNEDMSIDFYMFNISESELIKYLIDRDCLNYLEAK